MAVGVYRWPMVDRFLDRREELARLERWWGSDDREPVNLYGRRRIGKSWLFRRFAHDRPAVILVAERLAEGAQLSRFAEQLAPALGGVTPDLPDVATLFRVLYRLGRDRKILAVIDEFPWLLGTNAPDVDRTLSSIQAVMEDERDASRLKLVLCGSAVGQMEALQRERNPLHGRLAALELRALPFGEASLFLDDATDPSDRFTRFAIAGGMPRYLAALSDGTVRERVCSEMLRPDSPLWAEGRTIVSQELREPAVHFSILEQLATGEKALGDLTNALRIKAGPLSKYLAQLDDLRLVSRELPFGAPGNARGGHWRLDDPFLRFWFRFVFPFQADLEAGLDPGDLFDTEIEPALAQHVSPVFEDRCRDHVRATMGSTATKVGRWWGNALDEHRRAKRRTTEEIDIVATARGRVTVVGEAKWTSKPFDVSILDHLTEFKIPALRQGGFKISRDCTTVLFCRSGYTDGLAERAEADEHLVLVDVDAMLSVSP